MVRGDSSGRLLALQNGNRITKVRLLQQPALIRLLEKKITLSERKCSGERTLDERRIWLGQEAGKSRCGRFSGIHHIGENSFNLQSAFRGAGAP